MAKKIVNLKQIDAFYKKIWEGFNEIKNPYIKMLDKYMDQQKWMDSDVFMPIIDFNHLMNAFLMVQFFNSDRSLLQKISTIRSYQQEACAEEKNIDIVSLGYSQLDILCDYYSNLLTIQIILDGDYDDAHIDSASRCFSQLESILDKKSMFKKEKLSSELIRRLLRNDFDFIIRKYENDSGLTTNKLKTGEWIHGANACYQLARYFAGREGQNYLSEADTFMLFMKSEWLGRFVIDDFGTLFDPSSFFLLEYSYQRLIGKNINDPFELFKLFSPDYVIEKLKQLAD